ncbi:hypothetical protein DFJ73DRAFT_968874 [Zopfochytrium polystomum]|nr:hypothetical protein DFJ73DRAFT_968874 [Zopfochytrium polystomum]
MPVSIHPCRPRARHPHDPGALSSSSASNNAVPLQLPHSHPDAAFQDHHTADITWMEMMAFGWVPARARVVHNGGGGAVHGAVGAKGLGLGAGGAKGPVAAKGIIATKPPAAAAKSGPVGRRKQNAVDGKTEAAAGSGPTQTKCEIPTALAAADRGAEILQRGKLRVLRVAKVADEHTRRHMQSVAIFVCAVVAAAVLAALSMWAKSWIVQSGYPA